MPRRPKFRRIDALPDITYFKPRGIPMRHLKEVYLPLDGFEAIRLADYEGLNHEAAAERMGISRQTFGRVLNQARTIVAKALISGWALCIQGGNFRIENRRSPESMAVPADADEQQRSPAAGRTASVAPPIEKEDSTMAKIAISSEGPELDDLLDSRFGRAAGFIIVDPETLSYEYQENGSAQVLAQGAGIQAAETVAKTGAGAVLTGYVGPKAFMALQAAGIKIAHNLENLTVRQAIERFRQGQVEWAESPNRMGHGR